MRRFTSLTLALALAAPGCTIFFDPSSHEGGDAGPGGMDAGPDDVDSGSDDAGACGPGEEEVGGVCRNIDSCVADPCFPFVACTDDPPPGTGRTCGACPAGFEGDGDDCTDIDGCAVAPCFDGVTCTDAPAPGTGRTCGACPAGYTGDGSTCTDIDGCATGPCFNGVACTDVPAPGTGYDCGDCPTGYQGNGESCTDINGCVGSPCYSGVACADVPAPGTGFECGPCPIGYTGDGITCRSLFCNSSIDCDDGNPCTSDYCCLPPQCGQGTCMNGPSDFNTCSDTDQTTAEHCSNGDCISIPKCEEGLPCTTGVWSSGTNSCTFTLNGCTCGDYYIEGEEEAMVFRTGSWVVPRGSVSHAGAAVETSGAGARLRTWVLGTGVIIGNETGPNRGTFDVYVDGTLRASVDTYQPGSFSFQIERTIVSGLSFGIHDVEVVATSSDGTRPYVTVDYFRPVCP
jgi:hypothetical protein